MGLPHMALRKPKISGHNINGISYLTFPQKIFRLSKRHTRLKKEFAFHYLVVKVPTLFEGFQLSFSPQTFYELKKGTEKHLNDKAMFRSVRFLNQTHILPSTFDKLWAPRRMPSQVRLGYIRPAVASRTVLPVFSPDRCGQQIGKRFTGNRIRLSNQANQ